jgi:exosortase
MSRLRGATPFAVFSAIFLIVSFAYLPTSSHIISEWVYNGPYTHGFLALLLALVVVWQKRFYLNVHPKFNLIPVLAVLTGGVLWMAGGISNTFLFAVVGQFGVLFGAVWIIFGFSGLLKLMPALACILLVLPIWSMLQGPLQQLSILVTHLSLDLIGIPTLKQGIYFTVPGGRFAVETACSGLGFLLCSVLLAIVYSHFNQHNLSRAVRLFLFSILLALVSNWIRIVVIILVGNYTEMQHPIVTDHLAFGWVVFSIALVLFYWIANRGLQPIVSVASDEDDDYAEHDLKPEMKRLVVIAVMLLATPLLANYFEDHKVHAQGNSAWVISVLDTQLGRHSRYGSVKVEPNFVGASDIWQGHYLLNEKPLVAMVVRYDDQEQGRELIFVENSIVNTDRWQPSEKLKAATSGRANRAILEDASYTQRVVYSWYLVGPYSASNEMMAKFYELLAYFDGDRTSYLVALVMDAPAEQDLEALESATTNAISEIMKAKRQ